LLCGRILIFSFSLQINYSKLSGVNFINFSLSLKIWARTNHAKTGKKTGKRPAAWLVCGFKFIPISGMAAILC
jgi:hypothetical protein